MACDILFDHFVIRYHFFSLLKKHIVCLLKMYVSLQVNRVSGGINKVICAACGFLTLVITIDFLTAILHPLRFIGLCCTSFFLFDFIDTRVAEATSRIHDNFVIFFHNMVAFDRVRSSQG